MKNASEYAKRLKKLITHLRKTVEVPKEHDLLPPLEQLVISYMNWETTRKQGETAYNRLMKAVIDYNDLRVSSPEEIVEILGSKYARSSERAYRLRLTLQDIYVREHRMDLSSLLTLTCMEREISCGFPAGNQSCKCLNHKTCSFWKVSVYYCYIPWYTYLFNTFLPSP